MAFRCRLRSWPHGRVGDHRGLVVAGINLWAVEPFGNQFAPSLAGRIVAPVLIGGLGNVTKTVERLQVGRIPGRAAMMHRHDVVAFQAPGLAALDTPPPVTVEDRQAKPAPPFRVRERRVLTT